MVTAAATAITATAVLIGTGFFLWNAGDITEEAAKLPTAMYSSGWHNCHGTATIRVRKLVMIAMNHAQVIANLIDEFCFRQLLFQNLQTSQCSQILVHFFMIKMFVSRIK